MHTIDGIVYYHAAAETEGGRQLAMQMLKRGFAEFFHMEFAEENIKRNDYGKPYYDDAGEQIHFNISHCRDALTVAVSHRRVGVDVEGMRKVSYRTVVKCCGVEELSYVMGKDAVSVCSGVKCNMLSEEEAMRFLQLWTLKESYVKMTGEGLRRNLNRVNFVLTDTQGIWEKNVQEVTGNQAESRHFLYAPGNFVLALTAETTQASRQAGFVWKKYQPETQNR